MKDFAIWVSLLTSVHKVLYKMKKEQDYIRDIAEIRSMMERSSKFLSLSGWAGVMAGLYALAGALIIYALFDFNPEQVGYHFPEGATFSSPFLQVLLTGCTVLILAVGTAVILSSRKARSRGERVWNKTSRQLVHSMAVPLVTGGILIMALITEGLIGLIAPLSLIFYGIALYNAGNFTFREIRVLGVLQILLGLLSSYFPEYGLLLWAIGFGLMHIIYGIFIHSKYER